MLIRKINELIWLRWMKKKTSNLIEDKRIDKVQRAYTHRNPKKHISTGEFVIVVQNGGHTLLRLGSSLATVVSEAGSKAVRLKFGF